MRTPKIVMYPDCTTITYEADNEAETVTPVSLEVEIDGRMVSIHALVAAYEAQA